MLRAAVGLPLLVAWDCVVPRRGRLDWRVGCPTRPVRLGFAVVAVVGWLGNRPLPGWLHRSCPPSCPCQYHDLVLHGVLLRRLGWRAAVLDRHLLVRPGRVWSLDFFRWFGGSAGSAPDCVWLRTHCPPSRAHRPQRNSPLMFTARRCWVCCFCLRNGFLAASLLRAACGSFLCLGA